MHSTDSQSITVSDGRIYGPAVSIDLFVSPDTHFSTEETSCSKTKDRWRTDTGSGLRREMGQDPPGR